MKQIINLLTEKLRNRIFPANIQRTAFECMKQFSLEYFNKSAESFFKRERERDKGRERERQRETKREKERERERERENNL